MKKVKTIYTMNYIFEYWIYSSKCTTTKLKPEKPLETEIVAKWFNNSENIDSKF